MDHGESSWLEGLVHAFDLTVRPRVPWFGQSVVDGVLGAGILEPVRPEEFTGIDGDADARGGRADVSWCCEVDAFVGQHGMDFVRHGFDEGAEEVAGDLPGGFLVQFGEGELRDPVDGDEKEELALLGADLGDVDVEVAGRVSLELLLVRLTVGDLGQAGSAASGRRSVACKQRAGQLARCSRLGCSMSGCV